MKSLWMPIVRWRQVTEEGVVGGPVMPPDYSGTPESIDKLKENVGRSGIVGSLVANDLRSTMIIAPLLDRHPQTGEPLNYGEFSRALEEQIRSFEDESTGVYIVGFAKIVGDLIAGLYEVMLFLGSRWRLPRCLCTSTRAVFAAPCCWSAWRRPGWCGCWG